MAFKMRGNPFKTGTIQGTSGHISALKQLSPLHQEGPVDEKNPDLFEGEMEGTWVYEGSDLRERIIDIEDRIEFMQSDLEDAETEKEKKKYKSALKKLEQELEILLREDKEKRKKKKNK